MKLKSGFELIDVCGEAVVVAHGKDNIDFSKIINLNESAAYLWRSVEGRDFDAAELARLLCAEYEVSAEEAQADAEGLLREWQKEGLVS